MATPIFGLDIASDGGDRCVCVVRVGHRVEAIEDWSGTDTIETADRVKALAARWRPSLIVADADGAGVGVVHLLRGAGLPVFPFHGNGSTDDRDRTGLLVFANQRARAYWTLREAIDPRAERPLEIPRHPDLMRDLAEIRYETNRGGRIQIEDKKTIARRRGGSPDFSDALAYACALGEAQGYEAGYEAHFAEIELRLLPEEPAPLDDAAREALLWRNASEVAAGTRVEW